MDPRIKPEDDSAKGEALPTYQTAVPGLTRDQHFFPT